MTRGQSPARDGIIWESPISTGKKPVKKRESGGSPRGLRRRTGVGRGELKSNEKGKARSTFDRKRRTDGG